MFKSSQLPTVSWVLLAGILLVATWLGTQMMPPAQTFHDESFHMPQIRAYHMERYSHLEKSLTMIPGYHLAVATVSKTLFGQGIKDTRLASTLLSLPALLFFFLCARRLGHTSPLLSTTTYYLNPIFFPFFFVIYTDVPSLTLVLAGLYFTLSQRFTLAGLVMLLSLGVRQTNVMWLALFWLFALYNLLGNPLHIRWLKPENWRQLGWALLRTWAFPIGIVAFLVFVYQNGGVAIGDATAHKMDRIFVTQVFFLLLAVGLLFIPLHLMNARAAFDLLRFQPQCAVILSLLLVLYLLTFWAEHGYNLFDFFLRNRVVMWTRANEVHKVLAFIPMAIALLSLMVTPLREKRFYWLYVVAIASLLPHSLVDQRYFMEAITMFLLFMLPQHTRLHWYTLAIFIPVTLIICIGIGDIRFFI
ncbi:hypothetical protein [Teredinibacter turnerae]|uniref:hypothetical protein n=1 Tax=Teredinibacter turnerae TaxID=2426 RepID=UPI00040249F5|nr:hypothetical protein [Teredinibacter turnerae]